MSPLALTVAEPGTGTYRVRLNTAPGGPATVGINADMTSSADVSVSPSALTFSTTMWVTATAVDERVTVNAVTVTVAEAEDEEATYTVWLATDPTGAATVEPPSSTDNAVSRAPGALTFTGGATGNWQTVTAAAEVLANTVAGTAAINHTVGGGYSGGGGRRTTA